MGIWLVFPGVILIVLGLMAKVGHLPRNAVAGIRTQSVLASARAWRLGHQAAAPVFVLGGAASVALGLLGWGADLITNPYFQLGYSLELLITAALSIWVATRAAQAA